MREKYKIILLFLICLALYLPSIRSGYFIFDDITLVDSIMKNPWAPIEDIFKMSNETYYRAMVWLSYYLDARLWDMKPSFMHLVNILIHATNALLVYLIANRLIPEGRVADSKIALMAAIVFIVHPINTEPVNWISGRADPLATLFTLLATYYFFLSFKTKKQWSACLAAIFFLAGSLTKEVAFAMLPGFILTYWLIKPNPKGLLLSEPGRIWRSICCLPFIAAGFSYGYLRLSSYTKVDFGTKLIVDAVATEQSFWKKAEALITGFGFYLKKLIIPFPQSIAIDSIDPLYFWVGIGSISVSLAILLRRDKYAVMILFIMLPIVPALVVSVVKFALLSGYSERYLYMSSAFLALGLTVLATETKFRKAVLYLLFIMTTVYLPASINRNFLWSDHLKLLESIDVQNLEDATLWNAYCIELADNEKYSKARTEYKRLLEKHPNDQNAYSNLAKMELYLSNPVAAREAIEPFFNGSLAPDLRTLKVMLSVNKALLEHYPDIKMRETTHNEIISNSMKLFKATNNASHLLSAAESAMELKDFTQAEEFANMVIESNQDNEIITAKAEEIIAALNVNSK